MRDLRSIGLILFACLLVYAVIIGFAGADSDDTHNDEIEINSTSIYIAQQHSPGYNYPIYEVNQGDKVYLGDHVDISRVAAGNLALAWFTLGEPTKTGTAYIIDLPQQKYKYYNVYIDPAVFKDKTGWWYKWNGYYEDGGNTQAFYIIGSERKDAVTAPVQAINKTLIVEREKEASELLTEKKVADYLAVHGQQFNISGKTNPFKVWIFGQKSYLYDLYEPGYQIVLSKDQVQSLRAGSYTVVLQYAGNDTQFDVLWNADAEQLGNNPSTAWEQPKVIEEKGMQPSMVYDDLIGMLKETDDWYEVYKMEVQEPAIQIMQMDEVEVRAAKEYYLNPSKRGNVSVFRIVGYTNVLPGTMLKFALDEDDQTMVQWFTGASTGTYEGSMRYFKVDVPVYWDETSAGMHTISGYTDVGGSIFSDFNINIAPEHSYIPSDTVKWVGNRNPWIPTPTPEVVIQEKKVVVTKTVTIPVTPSNEQVLEQQRIAQNEINEKNLRLAGTVIGILICLAVAVLGMRYLFGVYKRAKVTT